MINEETNNIGTLLKLLDDPDQRVYEEVSSQLKNMGPDVVPELERAWEGSFNQIVQERLENIIEEIQHLDTQKKIKKWVVQGSDHTFKAAYYVARMQYPDLEYEPLAETIDKLAEDIWLELNKKMTALEKVRIINHFMFDVWGFKPNRTHFYAPQNNFINIVLDSKMGNPISLSLIYREIALRLNLPIFGVLIPGQFVLAYVDPYLENPRKVNNPDNILFYIHPFNRGSVLGRKEIDEYLKEQGVDRSVTYYLPASPVKIISRLISNLIFAYNKLGYPEKITVYKELLNIIKTNRNG